jgi:DNA-binding CsgD family transcriptional regulator
MDERFDLSEAQVGSLSALSPHIGQAFVLTDPLQTPLMSDRHLRGQFDRLRCGMVFCDAEGRVHWLNRSAERMLTDGPLRLAGSRLLGDCEADTTKLMNELAQAGSPGDNTARHLRLGRGERELHVAIQAAAQPSTMALTLTSPRRSADIPTDALIQLFGLTPTEALLVAALAAGSTLEQFAQQRGTSAETARVHLKRVNIKTGVQRQSDLVRLVWSSAATYLSSDFDELAEQSMPLGVG